MKLVRILTLTLLSCALLSTPLLAQDAPAKEQGNVVKNEEFNVTITPPAKWEPAPGTDKAVANFKHADSQSQIEVVGTRLMTPNVATVFFDTFHKTLKESNFEQKTQEAQKIGELEGTFTNYKFTHSSVTLDVLVYQFTKDNTAWLVVGYMQESEREKYLADFKSVVSSMAFKG